MMKRSGRKIALAMVASVSSLTLGLDVARAQTSPAPAAPSPKSAGTLDEVVVTAQRRTEKAQTVGIAVSAISSKQLAIYNLNSPVGITTHVAGVDLAQPNGEGAYTFSIRGVTQNDFADHEESPAAIYVDGVYLSQMAGLAFQMLDIDDVEVLRGPQGTLFGRNATGGLAQFNSKRPTDYLDGYVQETVGSFGLAKEDFAVGGPLTADDVLTGRLAVEVEHRDPLFHGVEGGKSSENDNQRSVRGQLKIALPHQASLLLISTYGRQNDVAGAWASVPAAVNAQGYGYDSGSLNALGYGPTGLFGSRGDTRGYALNENYGQSGTFTAPVPGLNANLTIVGDYQHLNKSYLEDSDTTPLDYFHFFSSSNVSQYSFESRLDGQLNQLHWIGGVYYLNISGKYTEGAHGTSYGGSATSGGLYDPYTLNTESYAVFSQVDYSFTDKLKLTAGARYTVDNKVFNYSSSYPGFDFTFNTAEDGGLAKLNNGFWSGKLGLSYQLDRNLLLYASANRGVKAGGFNAPLDPTTITSLSELSFKPETLDDFELGEKAEFFDRRLRVNTALYYYDYKNYQALQFIDLTQLVHNAPAIYKGVELELVYKPIPRLQFESNVAYNYSIVRNIDLNGLGAANYTPANAPRWNINGLARYTIPVADGELALQGEGSYQSLKYFALTDAEDTEQKPYAVANARVIFTRGPYELNLAVTNFTDTRYTTMKFDLAGFLGLAQQYPGRPREVSFALKYKF